MKRFFVLANIVTLLILNSVASAAPTESVFHAHAGRIHQHPLPVQGLSHRHGGGELGVIAKSTNKAGTIESTVVYGERYDVPNNNSDSSVFTKVPRRTDPLRPKPAAPVPPRVNIPFRPIPTNKPLSFVKGDTRCRRGEADCNVCAANVQQQFKKASAGQISWNTMSWAFTWPKAYPPYNKRPLDLFDGDPAYALGIPNTHTQGFVRTNSSKFPFVGSHSHKKQGGVFVVGNAGGGKLSLASLLPTRSKHPSGMHVFGKYAIFGEGSKLIFVDLNSAGAKNNIVLTLPKAKFGGGMGVLRLSKDNYLLVTTGPGGQKSGPRYSRFYHLKGVNGRPKSIKYLAQSNTITPSSWPKTMRYSENLSLITECGTGNIYAIHTTGDEKGVNAIRGNGYWRLSLLKNKGGKPEFSPINAFTQRQNMASCNIRASATVYVNNQSKLEFYCHGYAKDPDGSAFNVLGKSSRKNDSFKFKRGVVR